MALSSLPRTAIGRGLLALRRLWLVGRLLLAAGLTAGLQGLEFALVGVDLGGTYLAALVAILLSAVIFGVWSALLSAVVGWLAEAVWLTEPVGQLSIRDELDLLMAILLLAVAFFAGSVVEAVLQSSDQPAGDV